VRPFLSCSACLDIVHGAPDFQSLKPRWICKGAIGATIKLVFCIAETSVHSRQRREPPAIATQICACSRDGRRDSKRPATRRCAPL